MASPVVARSPGRFGYAVLAGLGAYLALLLLVPLVALLWTVGSQAFEAAEVLLGEQALRALALSGIVAVLVVVINGAFGIGTGIVLARHRTMLRPLIDASLDLPLALSPVMTGLAFMLLFGRSGWLFPVVHSLGITIAFGVTGVLVATLFVTLPFTAREVALVLEELGDSEEQAAATLGATSWQIFWRVTLPKIWHGLVIGTALTFARALGEFGAVLVLGGAIENRTDTATTFIENAIQDRNEPAAYGMALLLAAAAVALLGVLEWKRKPTQ